MKKILCASEGNSQRSRLQVLERLLVRFLRIPEIPKKYDCEEYLKQVKAHLKPIQQLIEKEKDGRLKQCRKKVSALLKKV